MTSQTGQYSMFVANTAPSYGSNRLTPTGFPDVHRAIDDFLHVAANRMSRAHEEVVRCRSREGPACQPYVGVAEYIFAVSRTLSDLTAALTQEATQKDASAAVIAQTRAAGGINGLNDTTAFFKVQDDKSLLKHIHEETSRYERNIHSKNEAPRSQLRHPSDAPINSPNPTRQPLHGPASPVSVQSLSTVASPTARPASVDGRSRLPNQPQARPVRAGSPTAVTDKDHFANYNLDRWKRRGKGTQNYCPRGLDCKKGGVVNGELVLFERNSAFIQHCNKHKRPFVCELPGCPNPVHRRSFARADGLRRHQDHVTHGVPCENNTNARQHTPRDSIGSQESQVIGLRTVLKPENDYYDPGSDDSDDSDMEDAPAVIVDTG